MPAAAVQEVGAAQAAGAQKLVQIVLHRKFQKEGTAAQRAQRALRHDGIDELLHAGKIGGVEQERLCFSELCLLPQQRFAVVGLAGLQQKFADAGAEHAI